MKNRKHYWIVEKRPSASRLTDEHAVTWVRDHSCKTTTVVPLFFSRREAQQWINDKELEDRFAPVKFPIPKEIQ